MRAHPHAKETIEDAVAEKDAEGHTIKRRRKSDLTPKAKVELEKPVFGLERSPARLLFGATQMERRGSQPSPLSQSTEAGPRSALVEMSRSTLISSKPRNGISGVVYAAPEGARGKLSPSPSIEIPASTHSDRTASSLPLSSAPSTPSRRSNVSTTTASDNIHDPGFEVLADAIAAPLTPISKGKRKADTLSDVEASGAQATDIPNPDLADDAPAHVPSSPTSVIEDEHDDQENVPPIRNIEESATMTPKGKAKGKQNAVPESDETPRAKGISGIRGAVGISAVPVSPSKNKSKLSQEVSREVRSSKRLR